MHTVRCSPARIIDVGLKTQILTKKNVVKFLAAETGLNSRISYRQLVKIMQTLFSC